MEEGDNFVICSKDSSMPKENASRVPCDPGENESKNPQAS